MISIVLPVHNQADHVQKVVEEYENALVQLPQKHELLLVTNGCQDNSVAICDDLAAQHSSVRAVHCKGVGWGRAVIAGLREAQGEILCYTNSARTRSQDLLLLLLYSAVHPDVVVMARRKSRDSVLRRLASLLYNLECRTLFDLAVWDINGTPKVFPRKLDKLLGLTRTDDLIDVEFNLICRQEQYPTVEIPIFSWRRYGGKSTTNLRSAILSYWGAYQLWRSGIAHRQ